MEIMFMLITVIGILVGEVGAEVEWKDSRSTVSEFSLECDAQRGSIVQNTVGHCGDRMLNAVDIAGTADVGEGA